MRVLFTIILTLLVIRSNAQSFVLGGDASITLGEDASFFIGGDATLDGTFNNNGTIISYSDLDVQNNTTMKSIKFVGVDDQQLSANDTLRVNVLSIDKESELNLVEGFIEGKIVSLTQDTEASFPMGVNGFYNAITLSNLTENLTIVVESGTPDLERLLPTEDMIGIADEVEWVITAPNASVEVRASAIFSGIDLSFNGLSNGQFINAQDYTPVLVKFGPLDTLYQELGVRDLSDTDMETFGSIISEETFYISTEPTYISVALLPVLLEPVFFVPDVFSPNSSTDENRIFRPYFAGAIISHVRINIIDSFQNSLYSYEESASDIDLLLIGWDGWLPNGQIADGGIYYYTIELEAEGETYSDFGSVLLTN